MSPLQGQLPRGVHQRFPAVRLTGRCFLLRPRRSSPTSTLSHNEVECVDLTHGDAMSSRQQPSMPGSLMGNSYYTQRYKSRISNNAAATTSSATTAPRFLSGDVILRLQLSAVPHALSGRRIVDVTGTQTSYFNSAERDRHALATVEETLQTMHLHDGHEVPALQRGDVDLVRLQPQCVYAPMLSERPEHRKSHSGGAAASSSSLDITNVASALYPLDNPGVLLAQSRRLSFRSEMDAVQVARVMAASVAALRQRSGGFHAAPPSGAVLKPLVRDGHLVSVALRFPRGSGRSG